MNVKALLAAALVVLSAPATSLAQPQDDKGDSLGAAWAPQQDRVREGVQRGGQLPLAAVVARVHRRVPGRMLDAGLESFRGRPVYRIRWLTTDGRRLDVLVDAATGAILGL